MGEELCIECESEKATIPDPRDPPYESGDCLCFSCADDAYGHQIEEMQSALELMQDDHKDLLRKSHDE